MAKNSVSDSIANSLFNDAVWVLSQTITNAISVRMALFSVDDDTANRLREVRDVVSKIREEASQKLLDGLEKQASYSK
jgi:hypothetical protein